MQKKLGKGLDALISEGSQETGKAKQKVEQVGITSIVPNRFQPRKKFNDKEMEDLVRSIEEKGLIQPILVRPVDEGYDLIAGERRWRAAERLKFKKVPAIVRKNITDEESLQLSIVENIQREQLDPIEESNAYQELVNRFGHTLGEVGKVMGKDKSTISNSLRLLTLPKEVQNMLSLGKISTGHAKALLSVSSDEKKKKIARRIIDEALSVRKTEQIVQQLTTIRKPKRIKEKSPEIQDIEDRLREKLGTKVTISHGKKRGKVEIQYYSPEDLNRLLDLIL